MTKKHSDDQFTKTIPDDLLDRHNKLNQKQKDYLIRLFCWSKGFERIQTLAHRDWWIKSLEYIEKNV